MDWQSTDSASTICAKVTAGSFGVASMMRSHLKDDPRIIWAIQQMSVSSSVWKTEVDAWIDDWSGSNHNCN